jgi:hypothetical protein
MCHSRTPPARSLSLSPSSPSPFTQSPFPHRSLVCDGQTSPHRPRLVVSRCTCLPPLSPSPQANNFLTGTVVINTYIHTCVTGVALTVWGSRPPPPPRSLPLSSSSSSSHARTRHHQTQGSNEKFDCPKGGRAGQNAQFAGTGQRADSVHLVEKLCSFYHLDHHRHTRERAGMRDSGGSAVGVRYIVRGGTTRHKLY